MKSFSLFWMIVVCMLDTGHTKSVTYSYKRQICTTTEFVDLCWQLTFFSDGKFSYRQMENSTIKNKLVMPNDTIFYSGSFVKNNDTLELRSLTGKTCTMTPKYLLKGDKLYSIYQNCIDTLKGKAFPFLTREKK